MNKIFTNYVKTQVGVLCASLLITAIFIAISAISAIAQKAQINRDNPVISDLYGSPKQIAGGDLMVEKTMPIGSSIHDLILAPSAVAANSIYSNVTTFLGQAYANGGGSGTTVKTVLVADDLTARGTAPISVTGFKFSMANLNTVAVSVSPTIYFYQANGTNGGPGTLITSFAFNPISLNAGNVSVFNVPNAPFTLPTTTFWAGVAFDRGGTSTATTDAQLNNFGQGLFNPVDRGSSPDNFFVSTASATGANNPAGGQFNFGGAPVANFGWEILAATTVLSINRADANPQQSGATAHFTVTFNTPVSGLTASNFALATTGSITGASITAVTPVGATPTQTYTVTVSLGTGTGSVGLNLANFTGLNTTGTNTLPFAGQTYTVNAPTADGVLLEGRVFGSKGLPLRNALVTLTDSRGNTHTVLSGISGTFRFADIPAGDTVIVSIQSKRYNFTPQVISTTENLIGLNFFPATF